MNGRELFEIYAEEAHDGQRDLYWDFLTGKERDMWARIAARVEKPEVHALFDPYKVDAARYPLCDTEVHEAIRRGSPGDVPDEGGPLSPQRVSWFRRVAALMTEELNPKALAAANDTSKVRLDLLEAPADEAIANVLDHGAEKYGVENYRAIPIHLRTYIAATRRHLNALKRGEDIDPDSGESHWAHIGANVHVVMGALDEGTLVDDRGPGTPTEVGIAANQERTAKPC